MKPYYAFKCLKCNCVHTSDDIKRQKRKPLRRGNLTPGMTGVNTIWLCPGCNAVLVSHWRIKRKTWEFVKNEQAVQQT